MFTAGSIDALTAAIGCDHSVETTEGVVGSQLHVGPHGRRRRLVAEDAAHRFDVERVAIEIELACKLAEQMSVHDQARFGLHELGDGLRETDAGTALTLSTRKQVRRGAVA